MDMNRMSHVILSELDTLCMNVCLCIGWHDMRTIHANGSKMRITCAVW